MIIEKKDLDIPPERGSKSPLINSGDEDPRLDLAEDESGMMMVLVGSSRAKNGSDDFRLKGVKLFFVEGFSSR